MADYNKIVSEHSCEENQGCGVATICMCALAEDMADEIERLREALRDFIRAVDWCLENDPDRMSEVVFDAAVKARSALKEKE